MTGRRSAVVGDAQVDLAVDIGSFIHQHLAHRQPLDFHPQDLGCQALGFGGCFCQADPAGFAAPADQHLRFNNNAATQFFSNLFCFLCGSRYSSPWNGDAVLCEHLF